MSTVDLSPVIVPLVQVTGGLISALAPVLVWYAIRWVRSKMSLSQLGEDDALRQVVNQGLQKAIGAGVSRVQAAVAGQPMTIEVKNDVVAHAAQYAIDNIPGALKRFGLDDPNKLAAAIEARLGIMEMQVTTGQPAPAVPSLNSPTAQPAVKA